MGLDHSDGILTCAGMLIRHKAKQLSRQCGFTPSDRPDLEQELIAHVLDRLPRYDPRRGCLKTFIARVVQRKAVSIIRHQKAARRDYRRLARSLDDSGTEATGPLTDSIDSPNRDVNRASGGKEITAIDLSIDLRAVVESLEPTARYTCARILQTSASAVARELGLGREVVRGRIAKIRQQFQDAGLAAYLEKP